VPTFDEDSRATDSVKCCLAPWKKCVVAGNRAGLLVEDLPDVVALLATVIVAGTAIAVVETVIVETGEAPATIVVTTIGLATADTGRVRAAIVVAVRAAVHRNHRRV
jgi:hypothetical protein